MASSSNNPPAGSAPSAVAELLPDPTDLPPASAPGSADDLIASIADQQIDALINESDHETVEKLPTTSAAAAELAVQATQELQEMAKEISAQASADLVADLNVAATDALAAPGALAAPDAVAASAPQQEAAPAAVEAPVSAEAPAAAAEPLPSVGPAMVIAPADTEINQAEIDALISSALPEPAAPVAAPEPEAATARVPGESTPVSSAQAVAQELADDARAVVASIPPIVVVPLSARVRDKTSDLFLAVLSLINLPVRNLSDSAREVIGIIAIVTLVNAMSLLAYLMIFR